MSDKEPTLQYVRADEFFQLPATPNKTAEVVRAAVVEERARTILDADLIREQEAWSLLGTKVVGAEGA